MSVPELPSPIVRVRLTAPDRRALRAAVRRHNLDLCYGSVVAAGDAVAVEAFLSDDRVASVTDAVAHEGAHLDVLGPAVPATRPAVGEGDRFADGTLPHGPGARRRR